MGRIKQYIQILRAVEERVWFRWVVGGWSVLAVYDLFLSQLIPEEYAKKAPKAWEAAWITGGLFPWWGWALIFAAIMVVASLEYAAHLKQSHLSNPRQETNRLPSLHMAAMAATYLSAYEVIHYLADGSQWGEIEEAEVTPEGLSKNVMLEAPEEFKRKAEEGKLRVYGYNDKTHAHELIDKTYWMSAGLDSAAFNPNVDCVTAPATFDSAFHGIPIVYSDLKIVAEDVYRTWPKRVKKTMATALPEYISMKDAAQELYTAWRFSSDIMAHAAERMSGRDGSTRVGSPEDILNFAATHIGTKIAVYGKRLPSDHLEKIGEAEIGRSYFDEGASRLRDKMYDKSIFWVDLCVRSIDFKPLISSLSRTKTDNFVPFHKAVAYVAERIGDTNEGQCYPSTLTVLRQRAADGRLRIRGCKQLDTKDGTRFSDIHIDVPKEYWKNSTLGALATSPANVEGDTHTNPETVYAWGPRGVYEPNRYSNLLVEWNEVLSLWPE